MRMALLRLFALILSCGLATAFARVMAELEAASICSGVDITAGDGSRGAVVAIAGLDAFAASLESPAVSFVAAGVAVGASVLATELCGFGGLLADAALAAGAGTLAGCSGSVGPGEALLAAGARSVSGIELGLAVGEGA